MFNCGVRTVKLSTKCAAPERLAPAPSKPTLIVCYGNALRGDDGVAWKIANLLRVKLDDERIELICCSQLTPELAEEMSHAARVLFVDACVEGFPGDIRWSPIDLADPSEKNADAAAFSHHSTPRSLLALCSALYGEVPDTTEVTVCGSTFSLSEELSAVVEAGVQKAVEDIAGWTLTSLNPRKCLPNSELSI
jgi:hydrogenase maturation protease